MIVVFFFLQYAKIRTLQLFKNFFHKFCDENQLEEMEMDRNSLYLALADVNLDDFKIPEKKA